MAALKSINQDDLRNHNLSVVLDTMLRSVAPMSRAELAKATGLTKATMSLLVPMLLEGKVSREGEPSSLSAYGRPSTPIIISQGTFCGVGLQINTDGYGYMVLDLNDEIIDEQWVSQSMGNSDPDTIFAELDSLVRQGEKIAADKGLTIVGAGLALPGLVTDDMELLTARNLGWERLSLGMYEVVKRLDARADNEANMAALAQIPGYATQRKDGGIVGPSDSFVYISTDIGIGGALVREGNVVRGNHGFAGELGHVSVAFDGPTCACGRRGCLEAYAGRRALVESAGIASGTNATRIEAIDELLKRWEARDAAAVQAVDIAVRALASVIASTINASDIDTVILGGLWERFGGGLTRRLQEQASAQLLAFPEVQAHVLMPDLNARPALKGAAEVGLRCFLDNPMRYLL